MLTQCPSCQTTFRVTSEILRVAEGQVRCGRCQTQFDALERLIEESDTGEIQSGRYLRPPQPAPPPAPARGQIEVEEPATHEDITLEGRRIEISGTYRVLDESGRGEPQIREETVEEWVEIEDIDETPSAQDSGEVIEVDELGDDEVSNLDDDEVIDVADEFESESDFESGDEAASRDDAADELIADDGDDGAVDADRNEAQEQDDAEDMDLLPRRRRAAVARIWKILVAPLALLLIAQLVHHHRATLARHPRLGPPLMRVYDALNLTLRPDWNLHAYEVIHWHMGSDPERPGTLKFRASLKNAADYAQPYPLLKLVLQDRWGGQVRARTFEPAEYLDPTTAPDRLLAPAQQATATIAIADPGPDAEGFDFDVCLRGASGPVCAADVPEQKR